MLTTYLFTIHQFQITLVHLSRYSVCGGRFPVIWTPQLSITWTRSGTIFVIFCRELVSYIYCICVSKILFIIILSSTFVCTVHSNREKKEKMFIIFSGHAQASDPDPEVAAKHGEDARQWEYQGVSFPFVAFFLNNWMKF